MASRVARLTNGLFCGLAIYASFSAAALADAPRQQVAALPAGVAPAARKTWMLHLTGISGRKWVDDQLVEGFHEAGFPGDIEVYDWTGDNAGLGALKGLVHNQVEAQKVADLITDKYRKDPGLRIIVTGHSGGTGIATWALEKLPADVKVDDVIFMASALSPDYDLSRALAHVRHRCYSFCSQYDILVLAVGCRTFGTIDGKKTEAAGYFGFVFPPGGDLIQYGKLIQKPFDKAWMKFGNIGDHMGCMVHGFAGNVVAPLVIDENK